MDFNNYNSAHIISEVVVMGGISLYFHKKISELESTIEELKGQVAMQNSQIRYLLGSNHSGPTTPLKIPTQPQVQSRPQTQLQPQVQSRPQTQQATQECEGGVCPLVVPSKQKPDKKVVISKVSKQVEFDSENTEPYQTSRVNTFSNSSPNPVLKSVTPKPSTSDSTTELERILNDINNE